MLGTSLSGGIYTIEFVYSNWEIQYNRDFGPTVVALTRPSALYGWIMNCISFRMSMKISSDSAEMVNRLVGG